VLVWNAATGGLKKKFVTDPPAKQYAVAFDSEKPAKYVASGGEDGLINIWSLREGASNAHKAGHKNAAPQDRIVHSLSYAPNSSSEFVSAGFDGKINYYFFSASDRPDVASENARSTRVLRVAYAPRDERVVSGGTDGKLTLWLAKNEKITRIRSYGEYGPKESVTAVAWSPDGKQLLSGSGGGNPMRLWDVNNESRSLRQYAGHKVGDKKDVEGVAFHPSWPRIVSVSEDGTMKVWDANSSSELFTVVPFKDGQYLAYTPGGCYTGSAEAGRRFKLRSDGKVTALTKDLEASLFVPGGFGKLIAQR
jgi:WD40 repeat protein